VPLAGEMTTALCDTFLEKSKGVTGNFNQAASLSLSATTSALMCLLQSLREAATQTFSLVGEPLEAMLERIFTGEILHKWVYHGP
jgi:hypothetical protein